LMCDHMYGMQLHIYAPGYAKSAYPPPKRR